MSPAFRLSLAANLALAGVVAVLLWRDRSAASLLVAARAPAVPARLESAGTAVVVPAQSQKSAGPKLTPSAVAELAQLGVSRDIVVSVLLEDLNRRTTARLLALQKKFAPGAVPDRELRELSRQSEAEQARELRAALGEEGYRAWDKEQTLHALNRARVPGDELPMSAAEAEQAYRLQKEFDETNRELQMAMEDGVADKTDSGTLQAQAQQTLDRGLEQLLGQQRFNELRGNTDATTEVYRTYGDLGPTPGQAQAVLQAEGDYRTREAALAQRLKENPGDAANIAGELKAMSEAQDEKLRETFGAAAYDNLKRQNDPTYQALQQYAGTWGLNDQDIQSVYAAIQPFQDQAGRIRAAAEMSEAAGQRVNWREVDSAIEHARQQTEAGLQNLIGAERLQRLKQNGVLATR